MNLFLDDTMLGRGDCQASPISGIRWWEEVLVCFVFHRKFLEEEVSHFLPFKHQYKEFQRTPEMPGRREVGLETGVKKLKSEHVPWPLVPTHHHYVGSRWPRVSWVPTTFYTRGVLLVACKGMTSHLTWSQLWLTISWRKKETCILCAFHI